MDVAGLPVTFLDTAGLRATSDPLEQAGIERARMRADAADLRVFLLLQGEVPDLQARGDDILIEGKADQRPGPSERLAISGVTGAGIAELMVRIGEILQCRVSSAGVLVRERHRVAVLAAITALEEVRLEVIKCDSRVELAAEGLRGAVFALDTVVGRVDVEDLLTEIFASFCIGK